MVNIHHSSRTRIQKPIPLASDASLPSPRTIGRANGILDEASDVSDETEHILHSYGHREDYLWKPGSIQANKKLYRQLEIIFCEFDHSGQ